MNSHLTFKFIDGFYQNIDLTFTREMFTKVLHQRSKAYQERYHKSLFPLGSEDFICQHVAIEDSQTQEILGSFKYLNLKTCQKYNIEFPLLSTLKPPHSRRHFEQVQARISELEKQQKNVAYIGSLNIDAKLKTNRERRKLVKNMLAAGIVHCSDRDEADSILVTGSIPNGSHLFIQWLGFDLLSNEPVIVKNIGQTSAYVMERERWSEPAIQNADTFSEQWQQAFTRPEELRVQETEKANRTA